MSDKRNKYTVDGLLRDRVAMDHFIRDLSRNGLTNLDGSAFRQVRLCYYEGGVLIKSNYHLDNHCGIGLAPSPDSRAVAGCQESCAHGDANPRIVGGGEFTWVWSDGTVIVEGPWWPKIRDILARLIERLEVAVTDKALREQAEQLARVAKQASKDAALLKAWSNS